MTRNIQLILGVILYLFLTACGIPLATEKNPLLVGESTDTTHYFRFNKAEKTFEYKYQSADLGSFHSVLRGSFEKKGYDIFLMPYYDIRNMPANVYTEKTEKAGVFIYVKDSFEASCTKLCAEINGSFLIDILPNQTQKIPFELSQIQEFRILQVKNPAAHCCNFRNVEPRTEKIPLGVGINQIHSVISSSGVFNVKNVPSKKMKKIGSFLYAKVEGKWYKYLQDGL